jgi:hypothetical protein
VNAKLLAAVIGGLLLVINPRVTLHPAGLSLSFPLDVIAVAAVGAACLVLTLAAVRVLMRFTVAARMPAST